MNLLKYPEILTSIRKIVTCLVTSDKPVSALTPPPVRRSRITRIKGGIFLGPQTESDAKVLKRLQMGEASAYVLEVITGLKRPRVAIARLRKRGLEISMQRRFNAPSLSHSRRECVYSLSRRDKAIVERSERSLAQESSNA